MKRFKYIVAWARQQGIVVERVNRRRIDFWYADDSGTVGSVEHRSYASNAALTDSLQEFLDIERC